MCVNVLVYGFLWVSGHVVIETLCCQCLVVDNESLVHDLVVDVIDLVPRNRFNVTREY